MTAAERVNVVRFYRLCQEAGIRRATAFYLVRGIYEEAITFTPPATVQR